MWGCALIYYFALFLKLFNSGEAGTRSVQTKLSEVLLAWSVLIRVVVRSQSVGKLREFPAAVPFSLINYTILLYYFFLILNVINFSYRKWFLAFLFSVKCSSCF